MNPFRSEAEAFRFLILVIGFCALIAVCAMINVWLGLVAFLAESGVLGWLIFSRLRANQANRG